ncbi:MAG: two-component regulator propeller domain-containing protein [Bacteroidota bacterium]
MQARNIICTFFLLWNISLHSLLAQDKSFQTYSIADGLPQSKISSLLQDSRGFLWIGTQSGGLASFDGISVKSYGKPEGLHNNHIYSLFEDQEGKIWIGTREGISFFDGKNFKRPKEKILKKPAIHHIWQQKNGRLWIGGSQGVFYLKDKKWEALDPENKFKIRQLNVFHEDKNGAIWIGHSRGLLRILGKEIKPYSSKEGLSSPNIKGMGSDADGNLWVSSFLGGLDKYDGRKFHPQFVDSRFHEGFIECMHIDREGKLWLGNQLEGLASYDLANGQISYFNQRNGLANNHITAIIDDSWGNLWIGSEGGGISKFSSKPFSHFGRKQGLKANSAYSFEEDKEGNMWIGNGDQGIAVWGTQGFSYYDRQNLFKQVRVNKIFRDSKDRMWIGTQGRGLAIFQDTAFYFFPNSNDLRANIIQDIQEDKKGNIWIASRYNGIYRLEVKEDSSGISIYNTAFRKTKGLLSDQILALHLDKKNRIWYASKDNGLGYIEKDSLIGKLPTPILEKQQINCLAEDAKGYLWMGTADQGLVHMYLYDRKFPHAKHSKALSSDLINFVIAEGENKLWVGTASGLDKVSLDFERNFEQIKHFGRAEGLEDIETHPKAAYLDESGQLWIGANSGFSIHQTALTQKKSGQPKIYLAEILLDYEPLQTYPTYQELLGPWGKIKDRLNFLPDENNLLFSFGGIDLSEGGNLRYKYRMKGLDNKWSPARNRTDASYPKLAPGNYTFEVKSVNGEGQESESLEIPLMIESPIYQKPWFIASALGILALFLFIGFRIRLNQVRKLARKEQEKLQIEKDLIQLEQKALRLQMNPHFLFNALNSIQGLIAREDSKKARYYLAKFSKLMRLVLENSRESMIPLSDEIDTLEHYLTVEQFSSGEKFQYKITCDQEIDPEEFLIPPMMIQPFIENSIIHGIAHLTTPGKISVEFRKIGKRIECYVSDNGVGRKKAAEMKSQVAHKHKSTALLVTQERLDILSKGADWGKSIEIVDLTDAQGKAAGTRVIVRMPLIRDI